MAQKSLAGSASLHLTMGAFGLLFTTLAVAFNPFVAFALALVASYALAKL